MLIRFPFLLQGIALCVDSIGDDGLDHGFCASVGIGGTDGAVLGDGDHVGDAGGVAVDGRGGGEDYVGDGVGEHAAQEGDGAADVDAVVFEGYFGGFAYCLGSVSVWLGDGLRL